MTSTWQTRDQRPSAGGTQQQHTLFLLYSTDHDYSFSSRVITLKVGVNEEELTVHEDRLRQSSPFFNAVLDKKWNGGRLGAIGLPEDRVDVVADYLDWLYSKKPIRSRDSEGYAEFEVYAAMYVFAERIQDNSFIYDITKALLRDLGDDTFLPGEEAINTFYQGTTDRSSIRRLLADAFVMHGSTEWFETHLPDYDNKQFFLDLAQAFRRHTAPCCTGWEAFCKASLERLKEGK